MPSKADCESPRYRVFEQVNALGEKRFVVKKRVLFFWLTADQGISIDYPTPASFKTRERAEAFVARAIEIDKRRRWTSVTQ